MIQNEDTLYQILFKKKRFQIKLILKHVPHKINRLDNYIVVNVFILCILLLKFLSKVYMLYVHYLL